MTTYTQISDTTTLVVAERRQARGWEVFTVYEDAEDRFVSYHRTFSERAPADDYAMLVLQKLLPR